MKRNVLKKKWGFFFFLSRALVLYSFFFFFPKQNKLDLFFALFLLYSQLAEQYGKNFASEIVARSRSNVRLDTMPYAALTSTTSPVGRHMKYDSLSTHPPNEI